MVKFKFLGTSAGEQYPSFWCRCPNCHQSRTLGGKNLRRNTSAYLMPDCLIDLPAEICLQAERFNVSLMDTKYLLVTHSDKDHLYPYLLRWRYRRPGTPLPPPLDAVGPRFSEIEKLTICGNKTVCELIADELDDMPDVGTEAYMVELRQVEPFENLSIGDMEIETLRANHGQGEDAMNYIIRRGGKTILYGLDTGWFLPETYKAIKGHKFDLVVLEATFGDGRASDGHFNFDLLKKAHRSFIEDGLLNEGSTFCATHFCPHFSPVHDIVAPRLAVEGIVASYDGMEIEL